MQVKRLVVITTMLNSILFFHPSDVWAKRTVPQAKPATTGTISTVKTKGITVGVKFRSDRKAIITTFANFSKVSRVDYSLSYNTKGTTQGATGSIIPPATEPLVREIIFGSCSRGVCRYDTGITNAKFTVTSILKNGTRVIKNFKLKI